MKQIICSLTLIYFLYYGQLIGQKTEWIILNANNTDLPDNFVKAIVIDRENNKWIGTANPVNPGGLVKFNNKKWTTFNSKNSELPNKPINTLQFDKENNTLKNS